MPNDFKSTTNGTAPHTHDEPLDDTPEKIGERLRRDRMKKKKSRFFLSSNEILGYSLSLVFLVLAVVVYTGKGLPGGATREFQNMMTAVFLLYSIYRLVMTRVKASQRKRRDALLDHRSRLGEDSD